MNSFEQKVTKRNEESLCIDIPIGLLINFNELRVVDGITRLILPGANKED